MNKIFSIMICACLLYYSPVEASRFYIWTDANGVKHISETPPPEEVKDLDSVKLSKPPPIQKIPVVAKPESNISKVSIEGNQVFVRVILESGGKMVNANLLLDTGASLTVLHDNIGNQLRLKDEINRKVRVAGGNQIDAKIGKVEYIKVGPAKVNNLEVSIIKNKGEEPFDGLLGMNFLRHFEYSINFTEQTITWKGR